MPFLVDFGSLGFSCQGSGHLGHWAFGTSETCGPFWESGASAIGIGGLVLGQEDKKEKKEAKNIEIQQPGIFILMPAQSWS